MKKAAVGLIISFFIVNIAACSSGGGNNWNSRMRRASKVLSELMPKIVLDKWDKSPKDQIDLRSLTTQLSGLSHGIKSETGVPSLDPSLKFISREFKKELTKAQVNMDQGNWKQAQAEVKRATQYCIACHSMTSSASSGYSLSLSPNFSGFSAYEKAVYYTAVRQFEKAIISFEKALNDKEWAKKNPKLWNDGVLNLMAIAGRIRRDPDLILELSSRFFDTNVYPTELKRAARQWQQDSRAWRKSKTARITLDTTYKYLKRGIKAESRVKHSGLVHFLRASSNINELLRIGIVDYDLQRSYYLSGQIAEYLSDTNYSNFAEDYYTLCVENAPKSKIGRTCSEALAKFLKKRKS